MYYSTTRRMRFVCWIPKATNMHSDFFFFFFFFSMARLVARTFINVTLYVHCLSRSTYPEILYVQPHHCQCHSAICQSDWQRLWLSDRRFLLWELRSFACTGNSHKTWLKFDAQGNFVRIPDQFNSTKTLNYTLTPAAVNKETFICRFDFLTGALLEDSGVFSE